MDIYNALGFVAFGVLDVTLYYGIARWFERAIERPWPWLAIAKVAAFAALLGGLRRSDNYSLIALALAWLVGGVATVIWQATNYSRVPNVNWMSKLTFAFMLGSFFSAFGCLGVKATLSTNFTTIGVSLFQVAVAAAASLVTSLLAAIVIDAFTNRVAER